MNAKEKIARRIAKELRDGDVINLGIGLPTMVSDYVPEDMKVTIQSENGILGMGSATDETNFDPNIVNAGVQPVTVKSGASFFDSATSFSIIRGGHVDLTVLGVLQVDEEGTLANHTIPGKMVPGMGGAMDLATGAKRVIAAMMHTAKGNSMKIMKKVTLPPTAVRKVNMIVTELAVIDVTPRGLVLCEIADGTTVEQVQAVTEAELIIEKAPMFF